jgi:Asp-tRNA(Asn)/Glu-tRNA(Gln) amidotransferase A subunit family amidase
MPAEVLPVRKLQFVTLLFIVLIAFAGRRSAIEAQTTAALDRDLLEITIPRLEDFYSSHKYTVTQVTRWYLDRIARYNGVYKAIEHVDSDGALATAGAEDNAAKAGGSGFKRGVLWGVPIVIKANTSVKGLVTSVGWRGYRIPGHELVAPADATVVAKLRAAGAIIIGQTNMPDFAASDTNMSSAFGRTGNAYDWHFSPGGSSGGTVTAVTANFAVFGTGTDTSNSIRMPSGTSSVVGVLPTRGLISIAGIHPLDWLLDDTGPIARNVTDAAIALGIMAGEDPKDFRTVGSTKLAQPGPYTRYLKAGALQGKRFGVPDFIINNEATGPARYEGPPLRPETRALFMKAIEGLQAAGATVVIDSSILPESFLQLTNAINTEPYHGEGTDNFLRDYGPAEYHSAADYRRVVGSPLPTFVTAQPGEASRILETDPAAESTFWGPQRVALDAYKKTLERLHLDGYVYPAIQMPPNDETIPQPDGRPSSGPHSRTGWVNRIGVPAVVVPAGFYENGLPFGLEMSTLPWKDGDLLSWAFAFEQKTRARKPPALKEP